MAYNRKNLLQKIIDIQEITLKLTEKGVSQEWIYTHEIYPVYRIGRAAFYRYLGTNAKKELKELESTDKTQLKLF